MINWLVFKSSASLSIFLQKEPERLIQGNRFFIKRQYLAKKKKTSEKNPLMREESCPEETGSSGCEQRDGGKEGTTIN